MAKQETSDYKLLIKMKIVCIICTYTVIIIILTLTKR